jgi:SAM-dependent methyltransferase
MNYINCNLCGLNNTKQLFNINGYNIVQCLNCGLVYVNPRPDEHELAKQYAFYRSFPNAELEDYKEIAINIMHIFLTETKRRNYGRLLDIGCGLGYFLQAIKPFCSEIQGIEISDSQSLFCKKLGLDVLTGVLTDLDLPSESFDVVTMWDVIEHLANPMDYLVEIHRILKRGGLVVVSTPNFSSLTSKITKKRWLVLNPPEHLFYFTPKTLKKMLENADFYIGKIRTSDMDIFNISNILNNHPSDRRILWNNRNKLYSRLRNKKSFIILRKIINSIISRSYLGDSIRVYAYKA